MILRRVCSSTKSCSTKQQRDPGRGWAFREDSVGREGCVSDRRPREVSRRARQEENHLESVPEETIQEKHAIIEATEICPANIIAFQFRQLMYNLISNGLKFSNPSIPSHIIITSNIVKGSKLGKAKLSPDKNYCHITIKDNGIGFEPHFSERIFEVFQKLHGKEVYAGTGIGLAIVKKIVENHNGIITATSELNKGAQFDIYIPA